MPRYFFFGLVRAQMYEYYWGHTAAQIELIDADVPFTCYKRRDKNDEAVTANKPRPGEPGYKPDAEKLERAVEKWKERKKRRKFDMKHYLATGEKIPVKQEE